MKFIKPSKINGTVIAPSSKSHLQRAIALSMLAKGKSKLYNVTLCNDSLAMLNVALALGAVITKNGSIVEINGIKNVPVTNQVTILNCNESGLCMRMIAPISSLFERKIKIIGKNSLTKRPVGNIDKTLILLGAECKTNKDFLPIELKGPIDGGIINVDGSLTSQFISGLMISLPLCKNDSLIKISTPKSKPYLQLTISTMAKFGVNAKSNKNFTEIKIKGGQKYNPSQIQIEGDWSGASFLAVAGALKGKVEIHNLDFNSNQADKEIITALRLAGSKIIINKKNSKSIIIEKNQLNGFKFDATNCPDLFLPLAALASGCKGKSVIKGVSRLKHKESDRGLALVLEFRKMGIDINISNDDLIINNNNNAIQGGEVKSHNDHRIAMACAIVGINSKKGVKIHGEKSVEKSFPEFFKQLEVLMEHNYKN